MTETTASSAAGTDPQAPRPAASLVLLRDSANGLEVLMMERPADDRVLSGAHVFPGGKLDPEDAHDAVLGRVDAHPDALHARLGEAGLDVTEGAALFVAAIREAFEEAGVLLADGVTASMIDQAGSMRREGRPFAEVLQALDVRLDPTLMHPWSRWITPKVSSNMRKRFDTRFFVARLPQGQQVQADSSETVSAAWMVPRVALTRYWDREIDMAAPQVMTLAHLSRFANVDAAMAEAAGRLPPTIRPEPIETAQGRLICYPGDPDHPESQRAMPGPTRLRVHEGRFSPLEGFEAWFA